MQEEQDFIQLVYKSEIIEIYKFLRHQNSSPHTYKDSKGYTALHAASLRGSYSLFEFLITYTKRNNKSWLSLLQDWVNEINNDGFTALHFASYRGKLKIAKKLLELGCNINIKNNQGLTVMHVAAQSNQALLLSYFYDLGVSITVQDLKGGTPLHWAANQGSEICASLLLGWDLSLLNVGDNEGQTALHLAASAGCSKIIKTLLIKGASRSVEDRKGKKPVDLALDKGDEKTARLLKPVSIFTEFGFKAPLRPPRSNYLPVITYLLLYGGGSVLVVGSLSQYISHLPRLGYFAVVVLSFVLFIIVCMKNPGYIESSPVSVARLYEKYESHFICPDCKIYRPARSRHCLCCDRCVEKYDHHCPWVNNCIGGKNLGWFLVFIVATWISLAFKVFICEETIRAENDHPGTISFSLETSKLVAVVIGFTAFLFEVPLSLLVFIQITNFAFNLTTNERFSRHGKVSHGESLVSYEREEKNCFQNCFNMCCNLDEKGRATCEVRPADEDSVIYEEIAKVGDRSISIEPVNKD